MVKRFGNFRKNPVKSVKTHLKRFLRKRRYAATYKNDSEAYWKNRLGTHRFNLHGVGDECMSQQENELIYEQAKKTFLSVCKDNNIDFSNHKVLDIGCGVGFYTNVCLEKGVRDYLGIDITEVLFDELKSKFPDFRFKRHDITKQPLGENFDIIIMIDVTQHITSDEKFSFAMQNIKSHLKKGGAFIVTSWLDENARDKYYEKSRSIETYKKAFPDDIFSEHRPFRDKFIFVIRKP